MSATTFVNANGVAHASQTAHPLVYQTPTSPQYFHGSTEVKRTQPHQSSTQDLIEQLYQEPLPEYEEVRGEWVRYIGDCNWTWTGIEPPSYPPPAPRPHNEKWLESIVYKPSIPYNIGGSMSSEKW
jgi:hypothetical protein